MTETRIIDFHDHPGPAVAERQRQLGIDVSVLLSVGQEGLETALRMSAQDPGRYVPFYWVDPFHGDEGLAEKHERIHLDTAFLPFFAPRMFPATTPEAWIAHAVGVAGAEKVLYGGEGTTPDHVHGADIPGAAQGLVLGGNAARLLGL